MSNQNIEHCRNTQAEIDRDLDESRPCEDCGEELNDCNCCEECGLPDEACECEDES
jgi:hypothetical protein